MFPFKSKQKAQETPPKMIEIFDANGNKLFIDQEEWRNKVLPHNIKSAWNNPDELYGIIRLAFGDGHGRDVLHAAERLKEIDPNERSYSTLGILLIQQKLFREAEEVFSEQSQKCGRTSFLLNNLAKVYAETGRGDQVPALLYEALELNPNESNALQWWVALQYEKLGETGRIKALQRIAGFPGAWRPQLWLGRLALQDNRETEALSIFKQVLQIAPGAYDGMLTISGDLGNKGLLDEMLALIAPVYEPSFDNHPIGLNLLRAYLHRKNGRDGLKLLEKMRQIQRFDLTKILDSFEAEFKAII